MEGGLWVFNHRIERRVPVDCSGGVLAVYQSRVKAQLAAGTALLGTRISYANSEGPYSFNRRQRFDGSAGFIDNSWYHNSCWFGQRLTAPTEFGSNRRRAGGLSRVRLRFEHAAHSAFADNRQGSTVRFSYHRRLLFCPGVRGIHSRTILPGGTGIAGPLHVSFEPNKTAVRAASKAGLNHQGI